MFTCISCRIAFETAEEQRSHFGTDWHRYNMKRRVANLPPVSAASFNDKVIERREQNAVRPDPKDMMCSACSKIFSSENSYRSHIQSKKHREREAAMARSQPIDNANEAGPSKPLENNGMADSTDVTMEDDEDSEEDIDIEAKIAASRRRIRTTDCLFCQHTSSDLATNVAHMTRAHSFFIPDQDILIDLAGLVAYLGEKIVLGNLCIFCPNGGKEFGSLDAVRKHMVDKAHCKIAYDTDEDRAELADFYDFGGSEADSSEWEDIEDDEVNVATDDTPSMASDGLSLVLPSGRTVGHRALKVYYAQRFRGESYGHTSNPHKDKVALVRQRLADPSSAVVPLAGGHGAFGRGLEVVQARNAGEAKWAKKQGRSFHDQRSREAFKTQVGFRNNNQKHFRDPLLQ